MLLGGISLLSEHVAEVNDLNVFPVPDGDTGTNMMKTMQGGLAEIASEEFESVAEISRYFAHGVLLGARGNSGVILSQIFAGINEELSKHETVDALILAAAFGCGTRRAYGSVQHPTEGTILTVFREATEYAAANIDESSTIEDFFNLHIHQARLTLGRTKEILPALKEADVVDSGGAGYLYIILGMYQALTGEMEVSDIRITEESAAPNINNFTRDSVLEFGYCTEFLLRLTTAKVDPDSFKIETVTDMLSELGGESVVAYKEGDIVKVHVHTFTPGVILTRAQEFGEFLTVKIENMSVDHSDGEARPAPKKPKKKFSVLTVATGEGMCALMLDAGADGIIAGGQSANPSTEEFINAFRECDSEHIIVLPNNKNVFLAAQQAANMYEEARVHIVPTKSLMQGYGALSVITPGITDIDMLVKNAERAAGGVVTGEVTRAVRNATVCGRTIQNGDYMSIVDGEIVSVAKSSEEAVISLLESVDMNDYEIITMFVGRGVTEGERAYLTERVTEDYPDCEVVVYDGGQDVYDYLIAIE